MRELGNLVYMGAAFFGCTAHVMGLNLHTIPWMLTTVFAGGAIGLYAHLTAINWKARHAEKATHSYRHRARHARIRP